MEFANKLSGQIQSRNISDISDDIKIIIGDLSGLCHDVRVMLFGSFVEGTAHDSSDIDLVVIVPDLVNLKSFKKDFYRTRTRNQMPVDFIFRNQSQFGNSGNPVDDEVQKKGVEIYPEWALK